MGSILKPRVGLRPRWSNNPMGIPMPAGAWVMNEGSGNKIFDSTHGNAPIGQASPTWVPGGIKLLSASSQYFLESNPKGLPLNEPITIVAGVKAYTLTDNINVMGHGDATLERGYRFRANSATGLLRVTKWGIADITTTSLALSTNVFAQVAVSMDTANCIFYVDNEQEIVVSATSINSIIATDDLFIGRSISAANPQYWDGEIYYLYIWSSILTASQIAYIRLHPYRAWEYPELWEYYAAALSGTVTWGHDSGVEEENIRNFTGPWTGTGSIQGSGDAEAILLDASEYMESETWNIGAGLIQLRCNVYASGIGTPSIKYKQGDSSANCEADTWHDYSVPFSGDGWIKVRIEN